MKRALLSYLKRPPSRWDMGLTLLAFVWMLWQLGSPGSIQMIPEVSVSTIVRSPLSALIHIHAMSAAFPLILLAFVGRLFTSFEYSSTYIFNFIEAFYYCLFNASVALLWLFLFWSWLLKLILLCYQRSFRWQRLLSYGRSPRWWLLPVLALTLCGLWATRLPLKVAFHIAKPRLEQIANEAAASTDGAVLFFPSKRAGPFAVVGAYHLDENLNWGAIDDTIPVEASQENASIEVLGFWVHQGFMRNLTGSSGELEEKSFNLVSGSSGSDRVFYLEDGWYAFQNHFD